MTERVSPHSLSAELSVLGAIILRNEGLDEAAEIIAAKDFFRDAHRRIFDTMLGLQRRRSAIDLETLKDALGSDLDEVGGPAYLAKLVDGVPRTTNVPHYAQIVREKAQKRALIRLAGDALSAAYDPDVDAPTALQATEAAIFQLSRSESGGDLIRADTRIPYVLERVQRLSENPGALSGLSTGLLDVDAFTCGLQPADMVVVGARSGHGKSTFGQDVARHVACRLREPVATFSVETSMDAWMFRNAIAEARLDSERIRRGYVSPMDFAALSEALGRMDGAPLFIDDSSGLRPMELRSKCRRLKAQHGLSLVIVDYAQLMNGDRGMRFENRQIEMTAVSRSVKAVAKELRVPIILLAQLRKRHDEGPENRPSIADLRESGSFENDADVVMLLHRPGKFEPNNPLYRGYAECIFAKQKDNPLGITKLGWSERSVRFENYTEA